MSKRFWVFDWLEDNQISTLAEASRFLPKYGVLRDLKLRAETASKEIAKASDFLIVAGCGLDLSGGRFVCPSPDCLRGQVDDLLKHVWHYFDRIVVRDTLTPLVLESDLSKRQLIRRFVSYLPPLLYLHEIEAEDLVEFVPKVVPCREHWEAEARAAGLEHVLDLRRELVEQLRVEGTFDFHKANDGRLHYWLKSPDLLGFIGFPVADKPGIGEDELQAQLAETAFRENVQELTRDVVSAKRLKLPLGATIGLQGKMLGLDQKPSPNEVIFNLSLPVLDGIPAKELIALRRQESESFVQFRDSLRLAVTERLRSAEDEKASLLAEEIRKDVIEPALHKIRQRLTASERSLLKKSGVSIFLGTLATTCGLLAGLPATVSFSALAMSIAATGSAAHRYLEDQQALSIEDMYFLWQAAKHSHD